jgi:NAD+-dependent protein deacetylase SIR2
MPPARKRRKIEPRIRTTQHLDLTSDTAQSDYDRSEALDLLLKALRKRRKIVVVAGAGISVSAGIPDFRSSHGLFRSLRGEHKLKGSGKELFDASVYKDDSSTSSFHDMVRKLSKMSANAKPTPFHRLLARLAKENRLLRLYTQNVDGLENDLEPLKTEVPLSHKAPWPRTIQLHGGLEKMMCQKCRQISDFEAQLFEGPDPPSCPECVAHDALRTTHAGKRSHGVGKLRPRIVLYNEHNPDDEAIGAVTTADFRTRPDAVVVVGTSMKIPAVRRIVHEMCSIVRDRREGTTIWINRDPVPPGKDLENCWDLIVKGDSDGVARMASFKEWDDETPEITENYTDSDIEKVKSSQGKITVMIPSTPKKEASSVIDMTAPVMTPPLSPRPVLPVLDMQQFSPTKQRFEVRIPNFEKLAGVTLKNPASSGRKISHVLGGKRVQSKPKTSLNRQAGGVAPKNQPTMASTFKVSKPLKPNPSWPPTTTKLVEPLGTRRTSDTNSIHPHIESMVYHKQASPSPDTPPGMMSETPPNMDMTIELGWTSRSRTPSPPDEKTISPRGYVPPDMGKLLN